MLIAYHVLCVRISGAITMIKCVSPTYADQELYTEDYSIDGFRNFPQSIKFGLFPVVFCSLYSYHDALIYDEWKIYRSPMHHFMMGYIRMRYYR